MLGEGEEIQCEVSVSLISIHSYQYSHFNVQVSLQGTEYSEVLVRRLEDTSHSGAEAVSWAGGLLLAALCVILL